MGFTGVAIPINGVMGPQKQSSTPKKGKKQSNQKPPKKKNLPNFKIATPLKQFIPNKQKKKISFNHKKTTSPTGKQQKTRIFHVYIPSIWSGP